MDNKSCRSLLDPGETLFFCTGIPKSGTTYLQRMLDCHPQISCPSEQQFSLLRNGLATLLGNYNKTLRQVGQRTGGQDVRVVEAQAQLDIFRCAVEAIVRNAAGGKSIMGANDNAILSNLAQYGALFGYPKMLVIFRNPVDAGLSAWHHNLRLAEEEGGAHKALLARYGGLEGWLRQSLRWFDEAVAIYRQYALENASIMCVRYEDLSTQTGPHLERILRFLGADTDPELIGDIAQRTSFRAMKQGAAQAGFFRSASVGFGAGEVSDELCRELAEASSGGLGYLGYDLVARQLRDAGDG